VNVLFGCDVMCDIYFSNCEDMKASFEKARESEVLVLSDMFSLEVGCCYRIGIANKH